MVWVSVAPVTYLLYRLRPGLGRTVHSVRYPQRALHSSVDEDSPETTQTLTLDRGVVASTPAQVLASIADFASSRHV